MTIKKKKPSMRYVTRKAKPEIKPKKKPLSHKFRPKTARDLLKNASYNNPLMKLQNDMISNLSDLTKRTSRFGDRYNVAVPVMRQQNPLLGNYEFERATNAKSLFHQPSPFGDYNEIMKRGREEATKREEIEQRRDTILNRFDKRQEYQQNFENERRYKAMKKEREQKQEVQGVVSDIIGDIERNERDKQETVRGLVDDIVDSAVKKGERNKRENEKVFFESNLFTPQGEVFQQSKPSKGGDVFGNLPDEDEEEETKDEQRPSKLDTDLGAGAGAGANDNDSNFYDYPLDVQKLLSSGKGSITLNGREIPITNVTEDDGGEDGVYILKGSFGKSGKNAGVKAMKYWQGKWTVIKTLSQKEILDLVPLPPTPSKKNKQTVTIPPPPSKGKSPSGKGKGEGSPSSLTYMEALQSPTKVTQRKKKNRRKKSKSPQGINVGYS